MSWVRPPHWPYFCVSFFFVENLDHHTGKYVFFFKFHFTNYFLNNADVVDMFLNTEACKELYFFLTQRLCEEKAGIFLAFLGRAPLVWEIIGVY